ncbi:MAG: DUF302 domain-containing protein [Verrucomicrobia bacterium]|nr:DUF302 domain-containing protein [Verrucomicrobiota bacterium]MBV9671696.1 DUF302 domain-containing protein [Verrucomicrobiota bacterium]
MKENDMEGLKTIASSFGPKETMARLESEISAKGMKVFARIDHAAAAADVGLDLRPTDLVVFGNARTGTPLMQAWQKIGIDLPLKALVWQDAAGKTWLTYNEPKWIAQRHGLGVSKETIDKMAAALSDISTKAANPD